MVDVVTGAYGFIGKHLGQAILSSGPDVYTIDLNSPVPIDIRQPIDFPSGTRCVYHLAALSNIIPSIENPRDYFETNVVGTFNVLEAARKAGVKKIIYAASASCYGVPAYGFDEGARCAPQYPYALTKYLGEQLVMHWSKVYKIPAVSLRLFNVYGRGSLTKTPYGAMFNTFLAQRANGKPLTIVGDGTQARDFVHVSDVVNAFLLAAEKGQGIYNIGTGNPTSVNRVAELIGGETIRIPKRPGEPDVTRADITRAKRELGWEPKVSIEEGIREMLDHLYEWKDAPVWVPEAIEKETKAWFEALS